MTALPPRLAPLLLAPLLLAGVAVAQPAAAPPPAAPAPAAAPAAAVTWAPQLRAEYLAGDSLRVPFLLSNPGTAAATAPDLDRRPWLIEFELDDGQGRVVKRRTTPPAEDPGGELRVGPRGQRQALLEVPLSSGVKPGGYELRVRLLGGPEPVELGRRSVRVAPPAPVAAHLPSSGGERGALQAVWLHRAAEGFDLYLHEVDGARPGDRGRSTHLAHLDRAVEPRLSAVRVGAASGRHVVWAHSPRGITYAQLQGGALRSAPRAVDLPWPAAEPVGQPLTDGEGDLHIPVWIPAPQGPGGELRVVVIGARGAPVFRKVSRMDARPGAVHATVDDAGAPLLLVRGAGYVDLYTLGGPATARQLPVPGHRLQSAPDGALLDARFGLRPGGDGNPGGLAVLVTRAQDDGLHAAWIGLGGQLLRELPTTPRPAGLPPLIDVLPAGNGAPGFRFAGGGAAVYVEGPRQVPAPPATAALLRDASGAVWRRELRAGEGLVSSPL
jgi:hypothetical protein